MTDNFGTLLELVQRNHPLVHCITNTVTTNMTANVLLALGGTPAMVDIPREAGIFAGIASGLLINLGTPSSEQRDAAREAAASANEHNKPWVLDPVAIGALPVRTELARELATKRPTAIRGNASEIIALAGAGVGGRGVDSADSTEQAAPAADALARQYGSIVAVSGPVDYVTDGSRAILIANGHELLTKVTGAGCALGAVIAAFLGAPAADPLLAVVASHVAYGIAAERAATAAGGSGTFVPLFLDALGNLTASDVRDRARIEEARP